MASGSFHHMEQRLISDLAHSQLSSVTNIGEGKITKHLAEEMSFLISSGQGTISQTEDSALNKIKIFSIMSTLKLKRFIHQKIT